MAGITPPTVTELAEGEKLIVKQMQARAGDLMPRHTANLESIVFVHEGECVVDFDGDEKVVAQGEAIIIPPNVKHQIRATADFKGIHVMPLQIEFRFFA